MADDMGIPPRTVDPEPEVVEDADLAGGASGEAVEDYERVHASPGNEAAGANTGATAVDGTPLESDMVAEAEDIITGDRLIDDTGILVDGDGVLRDDVYDYEQDPGNRPPGEGA